jgi:hypothetical protein
VFFSPFFIASIFNYSSLSYLQTSSALSSSISQYSLFFFFNFHYLLFLCSMRLYLLFFYQTCLFLLNAHFSDVIPLHSTKQVSQLLGTVASNQKKEILLPFTNIWIYLWPLQIRIRTRETIQYIVSWPSEVCNSSKWYLKIQILPQRIYNPSLWQRSIFNAVREVIAVYSENWGKPINRFRRQNSSFFMLKVVGW